MLNKLLNKLKSNKLLKILIPILLVLIIGFILYKNFFIKDNSNKIVLLKGKVEKGSVISSISLSGTTLSSNMLPVTTSVNGIVKKVYVKEGDKVLKGDKIMEITLNSEGEETLAQAWSSYLGAKTNLEQEKNKLYSLESTLIQMDEAFKNVKENNSYQTHDERVEYKIAENNYLSAENSLDNQKMIIEKSQSSLNNAWLTYQAQSPTITAPESGIVSNIVAIEGMRIENSLSERTSQTVASIKQEGVPIASLNASEMDINSIKVGQKIIMNLTSIPNQSFEGVVAGIDKVGNSSNGVANYPITIKFNKNSDLILPNMGVDAQVIIEEKQNVLKIPNGSLIKEAKGMFVNVISNGETQKKKVEVGISDDNFTEVLSGVNEGEVVEIKSYPTSGFTSENSELRIGGSGMGIIGTPRR